MYEWETPPNMPRDVHGASDELKIYNYGTLFAGTGCDRWVVFGP